MVVFSINFFNLLSLELLLWKLTTKTSKTVCLFFLSRCLIYKKNNTLYKNSTLYKDGHGLKVNNCQMNMAISAKPGIYDVLKIGKWWIKAVRVDSVSTDLERWLSCCSLYLCLSSRLIFCVADVFQHYVVRSLDSSSRPVQFWRLIFYCVLSLTGAEYVTKALVACDVLYVSFDVKTCWYCCVFVVRIRVLVDRVVPFLSVVSCLLWLFITLL